MHELIKKWQSLPNDQKETLIDLLGQYNSEAFEVGREILNSLDNVFLDDRPGHPGFGGISHLDI